MYLVLRMKKPKDIFTGNISVETVPGDPIGFCPVFATLEDARAVYPGAECLPMQPGPDARDQLPPCTCPSAHSMASPDCPRCSK